jgi:hypothetical protein
MEIIQDKAGRADLMMYRPIGFILTGTDAYVYRTSVQGRPPLINVASSRLPRLQLPLMDAKFIRKHAQGRIALQMLSKIIYLFRITPKHIAVLYRVLGGVTKLARRTTYGYSVPL